MSLARVAARWILLTACLAAVALPRFNLRDPGPIRKLTARATATAYGRPLDVEGYIRLAEYFRGQLPADSLIQPYSYRPLVPLVASQLPFDAQTAINVIDALCLLLTVVVLDRFLAVLGLDSRARNGGCLLFIVSFPTFYYGTIGFVDPAAVLFAALGAYAVVREKMGLFVGTLIAGVLVKETNAIFAVLPALWRWAHGDRSERTFGFTAVLVVVALTLAAGARWLSPAPDKGWIWEAGLKNVHDNLGRPRAYLSLVLTLGFPAALAAAAVLTGRASEVLGPAVSRFLIWSCGVGVVLYLNSVFAAFADGRVIWVIYPFAIALAATVARRSTPGTMRSSASALPRAASWRSIPEASSRG